MKLSKLHEETIRQGSWTSVQGPGYKLQITQFSNKGPLIVVHDENGNEQARAWLDIATKKWSTN